MEIISKIYLSILVKRSPKEEWTNEWIEGTGESMVAFCETKAKSQPKTTKFSFSVAQAKKAGLWGNNTWAKYPERMLQMRARGFCLRDAYPDVLNGLQLAEEMLDAQYIAPSHTKQQIETALASVGLSLTIVDGQGVATGKDTFNNAKFLKEVGFTFANNKWTIPVEDQCYIEASIEEPVAIPKASPELPAPQKDKKSNPKSDLMKLLLGNGITAAEAGKFVEQTFGDLSDPKRVEQIISNENRDNLMEQIKAFLNPTKGEQPAQPDLFEGDEEDNLFGN